MHAGPCTAGRSTKRSSKSAWRAGALSVSLVMTRYQGLFVEYEAIARAFPWTLTEVKELPRRERSYWFRVAQLLLKQR